MLDCVQTENRDTVCATRSLQTK